AHHDVTGFALRVFDEDIEVAVLVEQPGIYQLVLRPAYPAAAILFRQVVVRIFALRVLVEHLEVRMARRGVQVVVQLLDVLPMITLAIGESEQPLLENRIPRVPHREAYTQSLLAVRKPGDTVLSPTIGATAGVIVREIIPRIAVRTVVFTHGAPLTLGEIGSPFLPTRAFGELRGESGVLGRVCGHYRTRAVRVGYGREAVRARVKLCPARIASKTLQACAKWPRG